MRHKGKRPVRSHTGGFNDNFTAPPEPVLLDLLTGSNCHFGRYLLPPPLDVYPLYYLDGRLKSNHKRTCSTPASLCVSLPSFQLNNLAMFAATHSTGGVARRSDPQRTDHNAMQDVSCSKPDVQLEISRGRVPGRSHPTPTEDTS